MFLIKTIVIVYFCIENYLTRVNIEALKMTFVPLSSENNNNNSAFKK